MSIILRKGIVQDGQIVINEPMNLPDGSEVTIVGHSLKNAYQILNGIEFMSEDEQGDDPDAIQQWLDQLHSLPPVPEELKRECEPTEWDEQMKQFNLEAVRKQFAEGSS